MSHGFNGSRRFADYISHKPLPAVKRDVVPFRKDEPQEPDPMNAVQKTFAMTIARKNGELTDAQIADQHQTIAMELYPQAGSIGKALDAFYKSELGKIALGYAAQAGYADTQEAARIGDGDIAVSKMDREEPSDKDDAGSVRGKSPKIRHAHPAKPSKKPGRKHDGFGYMRDDDKDPNRPLNDTPAAPMGKFADYADSVAKAHAAQHGISVDAAYAELLAHDAAFKLVFDAAKTLPAE